jgi:hypothetical protein
MKIQMLITADYASVDIATGKLNILGAFTRINAKQFPVVHHRMAVVVKLTADSLTETTDRRNFELILTNEDGVELFQASCPVQIPRGEKGVRHDANVLLELNALEFPNAGVYEFSVYIDEEKVGDTSIELVQV